MDAFIIIARIPHLKIPTRYPIKIENDDKIFYFYPDSVISTLNECKDKIKILNKKPFPEETQFIGMEAHLEKDSKEATFIVSEFVIDIEMEGDDIFAQVKDHFKLIINLFSLLLRNVFTINKIFIFKKCKSNTFYSFIRMVEKPIFNKDVAETRQMIQYITYIDVEVLFPLLLDKLKENNSFIPLIEEFLIGRIESSNISIELMMYWNTLEHLVHVYWKKKDKSKLLKKAVIKQINGYIDEKSIIIEDSDVLFPRISPKDIKKHRMLHIQNRPSIKHKAFFMFDEIKLDLQYEDRLLIDYVYFLRNKLFHQEYFISNLVDKFRKKFKLATFKLKDFIPIKIKFSLLLEEIILKIFNFIPDYFEINKNNALFHFLTWNKEKISSIKHKNREQIKYERDLSSNKDFFISLFEEVKHDIFLRGRYISLLKYIEHLELKIKENLQDNYIEGIVDTNYGKKKIKVKLSRDLRGSYIGEKQEDHIMGFYVKQSALFRSTKFRKLDGFSFEFKMILLNESYESSPDRDNAKIEGEFFTLLIDIKKI